MRIFIFALFMLCTTSASAQNGFLQVFVFEDGIEVTVEGRSPVFATTGDPIEYGLRPGSYRITARKSGYEDLVRFAEIESDRLTKIHINLLSPRPQERQLPYNQASGMMAKSGILRVTSSPADQPVVVDGVRRTFNTPMEVASLALGYYDVAVGGCLVSAPIREDVVTYVECINGVSRVTFSGEEVRPVHFPEGSEVVFSTDESFSIKRRRGFEIGMGIASVTGTDDGESHTGPGVNATLGYGLSERYTMGLFGTAGRLSNTLQGGEASMNIMYGLFARMYYLNPNRAFRPYLTLGGGPVSYSSKFGGQDVDATGLSGMIGIGMDRATHRSMGYFLEVDYNRASFDKITVGNTTVNNIDLGLNYWVVAGGLRLRF